MSWWAGLHGEDGEYLPVESFSEGGTQVMGGSSEADLNVTYNYSNHYYRVLGLEDGFRGLDGMKAEDALLVLERGIAALSDETNSDYWKSTEGNAKAPLVMLKAWCEQSLREERPATLFVH